MPTLKVNNNGVWEKVSGLPTKINADTVDGKHASEFAPFSHEHSADDITDGIFSISRGGTGYSSIVDNTYIISRYRASALVSTESTPTDNGTINWIYE